MARTGRRPGRPPTKEAVLEAARQLFSERGYDNASVRDIALAAGVDAALVHHYFGTKEQLFLAVLQPPMDPTEVVGWVTEGGAAEVPERLVRMFLSLWDHPISGPSFVALLRSSLQHEWMAALLREFLTTQLLRRALANLDLSLPDAPLRASLIASQMVGLGVTRYILRVEPIASAPSETIVAALTPTVRRYLLEEL